MSITAKRFLFSIGLLIVWFGFITTGGALASIVMSALAGWYMGGLIYKFAAKVFPNE